MSDSAFDLEKLQVFGNQDTPDVLEKETYELTNEDRHKIKLCKRLRAAAMSSHISVDTTEHARSNNTHLFKFIEMCGMSVKQFILSYLKHLQPYSILELKDQEFEKDVICIVQLDYRTPIYLKVRVTQFQELVISFHENQVKRLQALEKEPLPAYSVFFFDEILRPGNRCVCTVSRGFTDYKIALNGVVHDDVIKVRTKEALDAMLILFNEAIENQFSNEEIFQFGSIKEISITSYGDQILNNVSKLIDYFKTIPKSDTGELRRISSLLMQSLSYITNGPRSEEYMEALRLRYVNDDRAQELIGGATNGRLSF